MWKSACPCSHSIHSFSTSTKFASVKIFLHASATNHGRKLESEWRLAKHSRNICGNVAEFTLWKSSAAVKKMPSDFLLDAGCRAYLVSRRLNLNTPAGSTAMSKDTFSNKMGFGLQCVLCAELRCYI